MDIYSTSFTYPRSHHISYSPTSSFDFTPDLRTPRDPYSPVPPAPHTATSLVPPQDFQGNGDVSMENVQKVAVAAMQAHGCLVSFTRAERGRGWNFHLSGGYQQVMAARGMILRECPVAVSIFRLYVRAFIDVTPADSRRH